MSPKKRSPVAVIEIIFDLGYLIFASVAGVYFLTHAGANAVLSLYGVLALTLCGGDAFHLLPRVYSLWTGTMREHAAALGFGKQVTSITMTIFYVLLYFVCQMVYLVQAPAALTALVLVLALVRIVLCFSPKNRWTQGDAPLKAAILRNVPFAFLGAAVAVLFAVLGAGGGASGFALMPLAIVLSFLFYFLVVVFAGKYPAAGALMLPKTCVYIWMLCMGFSLL